MKRVINVKFDLGETVRLKTDPNETRIVVGYLIRSAGGKRLNYVTYGLAKGCDETWHQESEIAEKKGPVVIRGFYQPLVKQKRKVKDS